MLISAQLSLIKNIVSRAVAAAGVGVPVFAVVLKIYNLRMHVSPCQAKFRVNLSVIILFLNSKINFIKRMKILNSGSKR